MISDGVKGFILSAGYGTRLKPITDKIPKPLVKLGDKVLIDYSIDLFKEFGLNDIGINIHHRRDALIDYAIEKNLNYFVEDKILGTGGYLKNIGEYFEEYLLTVNCDTLFFLDEGILDRLFKFHIESGNIATLVLMKRGKRSATPIDVEKGRVKTIGEGDFFFTGLQILSRDILEFVEYSIVSTYKKLIEINKLGFVEFKGVWFDCGTVNGLIDANKYLFNCEDSVIYNNAVVSGKVKLVNSVIYPARIEGNGEIKNSIVYEGASLNLKGEIIERKIIL